MKTGTGSGKGKKNKKRELGSEADAGGEASYEADVEAVGLMYTLRGAADYDSVARKSEQVDTFGLVSWILFTRGGGPWEAGYRQTTPLPYI